MHWSPHGIEMMLFSVEMGREIRCLTKTSWLCTKKSAPVVYGHHDLVWIHLFVDSPTSFFGTPRLPQRTALSSPQNSLLELQSHAHVSLGVWVSISTDTLPLPCQFGQVAHPNVAALYRNVTQFPRSMHDGMRPKVSAPPILRHCRSHPRLLPNRCGDPRIYWRLPFMLHDPQKPLKISRSTATEVSAVSTRPQI